MSKKIILTESQFENLMQVQMLNESKHSMLAKVAAGILSVYAVCSYINRLNIPNDDKIKMETEVINAASENKPQIESAGIKIDFNNINNKEWKMISNSAIVTVYNAVPEQCNNDCAHTASMFNLDLNNPASHRIIALERSFKQKHGIKYGDLILIKGTYKGLQDGVYQVQDLMNKRFKGMDKVDVLVNNDVRYGGTYRDEKAEIYVLINDKNEDAYRSQMAPEYNN